MPRHFSMIRDFHLADGFTLGNGACGTAALFFAMDHVRASSAGKVYAAGAFIVLALVFDVLDGRIARWRRDGHRKVETRVNASLETHRRAAVVYDRFNVGK